MDTTQDFWDFFESMTSRLNEREVSFRKMFQYLDSCVAPINIIETGCVRLENNWEGDGQSTVLFDRYVSQRGGHVWTVDINKNAVDVCRGLVSDNTTVTHSDSVKYLHQLAKEFIEQDRHINLCYLDSFDLDWQNHVPSSLHHLKELTAIMPIIRPDTLVVVDDSPGGTHTDFKICNELVVGKGQFVAQFAKHIGVDPYFLHYQTAWKGLR